MMFAGKQLSRELMRQSAKIGKLGENIAAKHLAGLKYLILLKNHREKFYEIDIIARHQNGALVFCEVKTLSMGSGKNLFFRPEDNLSGAKLKKLIIAAEIFVSKHPELLRGDQGWQIDLIAITLQNEIFSSLNHYENI